jgi:branched-chain amino acid transport system permease protein
MVIGGAGSIIGSLLGGAYYVLAPQLTNAVDANLTAVLQGALLLLVLFVLPGGLASLPARLRRLRRRPGRGAGSASGTGSSDTPRGDAPVRTAAEATHTERQDQA